MVLIKRFWHLREPGLDIHIFEQNGKMIMELHIDMMIHNYLSSVFFDCVLTVIFRMIQLLLGREDKVVEFWLNCPQPGYYTDYQHKLPLIHYDMPLFQASLPVELLDHALLMSNPEALKHAIDLCERESNLLGTQDDLLSHVREHMVLNHGEGYPSLEHLAERLHISPRTLRRRLQNHGTGYKHLLESARRRDALSFLDNPAYDIVTVAELLGYNNPTNFTRAFRQWAGKTPSEYRALRKPI